MERHQEESGQSLLSSILGLLPLAHTILCNHISLWLFFTQSKHKNTSFPPILESSFLQAPMSFRTLTKYFCYAFFSPCEPVFLWASRPCPLS